MATGLIRGNPPPLGGLGKFIYFEWGKTRLFAISSACAFPNSSLLTDDELATLRLLQEYCLAAAVSPNGIRL